MHSILRSFSVAIPPRQFMACGLVLAMLTFPLIYRSIYASALEMWPNGYNP